MGLLGSYSNPDIQRRLWRLSEELDRLEGSNDAPRPSARPDRKLRKGLVPRAIEKVLKDASEPMRVCDIHAAVEDRLGTEVPASSVNCWLAKHVKGSPPRLVQFGRGRYLINDVAPISEP